MNAGSSNGMTRLNAAKLLLAALFTAGVSCLDAPSLGAQVNGDPGAAVMAPGTFPSAMAPAESADESAVSPRGAFIRSLLIPGWGQVATGAVTRGGFYFAAQSASIWMLRKAALARGEAETFTRLEREIVRARLTAAGEEDPLLLQQGVDNDSEVREWENLVDLRSQQVEDWVALSLFMALIGAADAVVSAHLRDYPEPLSLRVVPIGGGERVEVGFVLPLGGSAR